MLVYDKIAQVLSVCLPVFAFIAAGAFFRKKGILGEEAIRFINFFTYNFSMPAIIFSSIMTGDKNVLFDYKPALVVLIIPLTLLSLYLAAGRFLKLPEGMIPPFVFSTFWSNITYLGYPLAAASFGAEGMQYASLINGVGVPLQIILGFLLIGGFSLKKIHPARTMISALVNPIVLSIIAAYIMIFSFGTIDISQVKNEGTASAATILYEMLNVTGKAGFPLALMMIGAMLKPEGYRLYLKPGIWVSAGKLVASPILAWLLLGLFGIYDKEAAGTMILLMGMPSAVTGFVVAMKYKTEPEMTAALLVITTILSIFTIPCTLYLILHAY